MNTCPRPSPDLLVNLGSSGVKRLSCLYTKNTYLWSPVPENKSLFVLHFVCISTNLLEDRRRHIPKGHRLWPHCFRGYLLPASDAIPYIWVTDDWERPDLSYKVCIKCLVLSATSPAMEYLWPELESTHCPTVTQIYQTLKQQIPV